MMWKDLTELEYNTKMAGDFPGGPVVKNPPCNAGDVGLIPGEDLTSCRATKLMHHKY